MRHALLALFALALLASPAIAQENYESWPKLHSTFPSTGGGGFVIKGYDPVIVGGKCLTDGKWRAFEGGAAGTTPFRFFFKDGIFRAGPQ